MADSRIGVARFDMPDVLPPGAVAAPAGSEGVMRSGFGLAGDRFVGVNPFVPTVSISQAISPTVLPCPQLAGDFDSARSRTQVFRSWVNSPLFGKAEDLANRLGDH